MFYSKERKEYMGVADLRKSPEKIVKIVLLRFFNVQYIVHWTYVTIYFLSYKIALHELISVIVDLGLKQVNIRRRLN